MSSMHEERNEMASNNEMTVEEALKIVDQGSGIWWVHKILAAEVGWLREANAELVKTAQGLVDKLELIHQHPSYKGVWQIAHIHHGPYTGPQYAEEFAALKSVLTFLTQHNGETQ